MFLRRRNSADALEMAASREIATNKIHHHTLDSFPLRLPLPLPEGISRAALFDWLKSVRVEGAPESIQSYCTQDFERFVHTYGLVQRATSASERPCTGLELGANPYFTTMLLKRFTSVEWSLANYFSAEFAHGLNKQRVFHKGYTADTKITPTELSYQHFNIEEDSFPFDAASFDVVLFCEIIEHLLNDPCKVLREIKRVLRKGGSLILTTPNVDRIENVARLIVGSNIYDPYSGYGPYGRHNREYNKHELHTLLGYLGFTVEEIFTADVHENITSNFIEPSKFGHLIEYRKHDLGQYIFLRATNNGADGGKLPAWLYRSYPPEKLE
ncbi:methyltransferase domain-containing protein [Trinickia sp. LjRoot230]|uniref:class I SAM-dependent methyltransferase n=1 Tax=Trinickia sp. LjRoot230 TaxID=3342288 RepID=UPI003ED05B86